MDQIQRFVPAGHFRERGAGVQKEAAALEGSCHSVSLFQDIAGIAEREYRSGADGGSGLVGATLELLRGVVVEELACGCVVAGTEVEACDGDSGEGTSGND